MDWLALGIVEAVHGVDAREHAESVAAYDGEEELKLIKLILILIDEVEILFIQNICAFRL